MDFPTIVKPKATKGSLNTHDTSTPKIHLDTIQPSRSSIFVPYHFIRGEKDDTSNRTISETSLRTYPAR